MLFFCNAVHKPKKLSVLGSRASLGPFPMTDYMLVQLVPSHFVLELQVAYHALPAAEKPCLVSNRRWSYPTW